MEKEIGLRLALKERRETLAGMREVRDEVTETGDAATRAGDKADQAGGRWKRMGGALGTAAKATAVAGAAIAAGVVVAGKALYNVGATFDTMADTIRVGTGATGKDLNALTASAKNVGKDIPVALDQIGPAVADINTRLGLTGPVLEKLSKQTLMAGDMLGEAIDVNAMSGAFSAFQVEGKQTTKAMDDIFRISQATGVGMNELFTSVSKNGPALKGFGFGLQESAAWIGTLDKAGLDGNKTLGTLSKAMVQFSKEGKNPQDALRGTISEIEGFVKAGDQAGAINVASKIFGTRGAGQFVDAVKSGKVELGNLMGATGATSDTILGAAKDTADLSEQWQLFKNRALIAIEPVATRVFNAVGDGMAYINDTVVPMVTGFVQSLKGDGIGNGIGAKVQKIRDTVIPIVTQMVDGFRSKWGEVQPTLQTAWDAIKTIFDSAISIVQSLWNRFGSTIVSTLTGAFSAILQVLRGAFTIVAGIFKTVAALLKGDWKGVWEGIKQILRGAVQVVIGLVRGAWNQITGATKLVWGALKGIVVGAWNGIKSAVSAGVGKVMSIVTGIKDKVTGALKGAFDGVKDAFRGAINWIIDKWNGLSFSLPSVKIPGIGKVGGGTLSTPDIPRLADGGIVRRQPGGILANIGEGAFDEAVVPLNGSQYLIDGSGVTPLPAPQGLGDRDLDDLAADPGDGLGSMRSGPLTVQVVLDRRVLGEVILDDIDDRMARR